MPGLSFACLVIVAILGSMTYARAHSNIALIKYWGKRDTDLKLPVNGSLSLTLDQLYTDTQVVYDAQLQQDQLILDLVVAPEAMRLRVSHFLDRVRQRYGFESYAQVISKNSFPTGAGLASSASAFAALALASTQAQGLTLSATDLSRLAREGSGSACRSIYGGFAEWLPGQATDGHDSYAVPLDLDWDLWMAVLVLNQAHKPTGSGEGMQRTVETSPLYAGWRESLPADLAQMHAALQAQDLQQVGELMEHSSLKMHATALAAQPAVIYWQPETLSLMQTVYQLRAAGHPCYFTMDAGPNVKVLMPAGAEQTLQALKAHPAVQQVYLCRPGPAAHLREGSL